MIHSITQTWQFHVSVILSHIRDIEMAIHTSARIQFNGYKLCVCSQKYKLTSKILSKSKKVSKLLRFENLMDFRFRHDLNHKNGRNSRNFCDIGPSFVLFLIFMCLTLIRRRGGQMAPPCRKIAISPVPNFRWTSDQSVNSSLSVVVP